MKNILIGFLFALIIVLASAVAAWYWQPKPIAPQKPEQTTAEKQLLRRVDSLNSRLSLKDSALLITKRQLEKSNEVKQDLRKSLIGAYVSVDSLEARYNRLKSFSACDSVIDGQKYVISNQKQLIKEYQTDSALYADRIYIYVDKDSINKSIISAQDSLLGIKNTEIANLSCAYQWKFKHKFWAWVFNWKCKN